MADTPPLASNTPPEGDVCICRFSVLNGYCKRPENYIIEVFDHPGSSPGFLSDFPFPRNIVAMSSHSGVHYHDAQLPSELVLGSVLGLWRTKGEASPCIYCWTFNSVSERTQCRSSIFLGHHYLPAKTITDTTTETRTMETTDRVQLNTCSEVTFRCSDTFHMLSLSVSKPFKTFFSFLMLFLC